VENRLAIARPVSRATYPGIAGERLAPLAGHETAASSRV
jgi:hypothetical protein